MGGMSFSALNPMNWFSNETLTVSANGLGNITASTAVTEQAIEKELGSRFHYRQGMEMQQGNIMVIVQALEDEKYKWLFMAKKRAQ